jgi:type I restriction enzyme S subunit
MKTVRAKASWLEETGVRLDAAYHLSEGRQAQLTIENSGVYESLSDVTQRIFLGGRFRRTYVESAERGYPYLTASDMIKSEPVSGAYLSKIHTGKTDKLKIEKDWILVSCSGSIGRTVYTNSIFEGQIGTHDLIRIVPNPAKMPGGYVYAYLTSKYGYALLTQGTYGGVIQHIEPHHIADLPVPKLPVAQMQKIHEAIEQAGKLREEANSLLNDSINKIEKSLPPIITRKTYSVKASNLIANNNRLDANTVCQPIAVFYEEARKCFSVRTISELVEEVFTPGIFKRMRVANSISGIPFLSGADITKTRPEFDSFLSRKMPFINDYIIREGWICIQDSGTIGYVSLINAHLDGVSATNNLIRIKPKGDSNLYLFPFLKTRQGQQLLQALAYGSVQLHVDNRQLSSLEVPIVEDPSIIENTRIYLSNMSRANQLETQAINEVELAISAWQK